MLGQVHLAAAEAERRLAGVIQLGVIAELDLPHARARVEIGPITTAWLPWLVARAGADRTWWAPVVGEQVVLASPSGEVAHGVILGSLYQSQHAAPADKAEISRIEWKDGTTVNYDREAHAMELVLPEAGARLTVMMGKSKVVITDTEITAAHDGSKLALSADAAMLGQCGSRAELTSSGIGLTAREITLKAGSGTITLGASGVKVDGAMVELG